MTLNKMVKILLTYYYVSALLDDLNLNPLYKTSLQVSKFALFLYVIVNLSSLYLSFDHNMGSLLHSLFFY